MAPQLRSGTRNKADAKFQTPAVSSLQQPHRDIFEHALKRVLSTGVAKLTFGQLADGLPISSVAKDSHKRPLWHRHPMHETHQEVCNDALSKAKEFRGNSDCEVLEFKSPASSLHGDGVIVFVLVFLIANHDVGYAMHRLSMHSRAHRLS
ncbi:hypothetical protein QQS21_004413 [Conoideocrella luteorostrata]|uniref:Uncharacterized protein n=1 Tax=Conoideocrella luteorostrata TaxID=1105319 RepID=A0AAJ0CRC1_9HYPO|nr:hypothetical protein QQS21_004413 [Conoideocrella luteorostrata]